MPATYEPIATQTLTTSATTVTFNSIPNTYTDLVISYGAIGVSDSQLRIRFNGDTGSNYSYTTMSGNGSTTESFRQANGNSMTTDYYFSVTTNGGATLINVLNYSNTTTFKTAIMRANNTSYAVMANAGLWRSTSAINQIDLIITTGSLAAGSVITVYGIKAA
jgi:predicted DNA binding protein